MKTEDSIILEKIQKCALGDDTLTAHLATICTKIRAFIAYMPSADAVELLNSFEFLFDKSSTFYSEVIKLRADNETLQKQLEALKIMVETENKKDKMAVEREKGKIYVAEELLNENLKFQEQIAALTNSNKQLLEQVKTRDEALSKLNTLLQYAFPPTKNFQQQYNANEEACVPAKKTCGDCYAYWSMNDPRLVNKGLQIKSTAICPKPKIEGSGDQKRSLDANNKDKSSDVTYSCCDLTNFSTCESNNESHAPVPAAMTEEAKNEKTVNHLLVFADEYGRGFKNRLGNILNLVVKTVIKPGATLENATRGFERCCANYTKKDVVLVIAGSNNLITSIRARVQLGNSFYTLMARTAHTNLLISTLPVPGENFSSKNYVSELMVLNKIILTLAKEFYHVTVIKGLDMRYATYYYRFNANKIKINVYIQEKIIAAFLKCLEAIRLGKKVELPDANPYMNLQYYNSVQYNYNNGMHPQCNDYNVMPFNNCMTPMTSEQYSNWYYQNYQNYQNFQNSQNMDSPPQQNYTNGQPFQTTPPNYQNPQSYPSEHNYSNNSKNNFSNFQNYPNGQV